MYYEEVNKHLPTRRTNDDNTFNIDQFNRERLKNQTKNKLGLNDKKKINQSLIGLLIQLLEVRPDIAFGLSKIGQQQQNPTTDDYEALIYMTHYLYGTRYWGICLKKDREIKQKYS